LVLLTIIKREKATREYLAKCMCPGVEQAPNKDPE